MSTFNKTVAKYRVGDDWRSNFKHINYENVEQGLKSILTKQEYVKVYDRLGNHTGSASHKRRISYDETLFRMMVLMDSQFDSLINDRFDIQSELSAMRVSTHNAREVVEDES